MLANKQSRGAHRGDRSAPHRCRRRCRLVPGLEAGHRPRCSPACWCTSPTMARSIAIISKAIRVASAMLCAGAQPGGAAWGDRAGHGAFRAGRRDVLPDVCEYAARVTLYSQGVNQSAQGTDKVNAILNCHLATGRIGRPGASPFFFFADRATQHDGRPGGRQARQPAGRPYGFRRRTSTACGGSGKAPRIATHED